MNADINIPVSWIIERFKGHNSNETFTVAISGIDAAGKGYISILVKEALEQKGYKVALINADPWQNPIPVRLKKENPAENFYEYVFRWNDLFEQLIIPLKKDKGIYLETTGIQTNADIYFPLVYDFTDIDILLVEGILLLKREYLSFYDLRIWVDCSFETGLKRAIQRNAETLDVQGLVRDYNTFYYPAQQYHFRKDDPKGKADIIFDNEK